MDYFILEQKENMSNAVKLLAEADNPLERKQVLTKEQAKDINELSRIYVLGDGDSIYPAIIDTPVFLVSDTVKKLLQLYEDSLIFKCTVLANKEGSQVVYWLTLMDEVNCLSSASEFTKDGSLKKLVIDKEKLQGRKIFRVGGVREKLVVINQDIAESLLRRFLLGIQLTAIESI